MKKLFLIRHAKSSWDDADLPDIERPLNERGMRDAPRMGKRLKEKELVPDLMVTSPAKRAAATCGIIANSLDYAAARIKTDRALYHATEDGILKVIKNLPDKIGTAVIFGHNPGLTDFVNSFSAGDTIIHNVPTCGIVAFEVKVDSWKDIAFEQGQILFVDYPKRIVD